ncbi:MAG: type II toxin-antitoxin system VapC family toxin [Dyadobacter sp.]
MGKSQYLIDTNAVIDFLNNKLPISGFNFLGGVIDEIPNLSIISKIEILGFNTLEEHYDVLNNFINDSYVYDLSNEIVDKTIDLRKKSRIKLPDAIVAATAIIYNYTLITRNISDFKNIKGLTLINLYDL